MRPPIAAILLCLLLCTGLSLADTPNGSSDEWGIPIIGPIAETLWTTVKNIAKAFVDGATGVVEWLGKTCDFALVRLDRPADPRMPTTDLWKACFSLYVTKLLPLSLTILAIFVMFSSQPSNRVVLEEYVKRAVVATAMAYFSFPIVDTLVWLTNEISQHLLDATGANAGVAFAKVSSFITLAFGTALISAPPVAGFLLFLVLTAVAVIALRLLLVHLLLAMMPALAFFYIIGVGPLRKLNEFVEHVWGVLLTLPIFSILGAFVVIAIDKYATLGPIQALGPLGAIVALAPLFLVLAFPYIAMQSLGMFSSAVHSFAYPFSKFVRGSVTAAAAARAMHLQRSFGAFAPLAAMIPSKLAAPIVTGLERASGYLGSRAAGLLSRASVLPGVGEAIGRTASFLESHRRMQDIALEAGSAFKQNPQVLGMLSALASSVPKGKALDATDRTARKALQDVSKVIASHARAGRVGDMLGALQAIHGRFMTQREALVSAINSNFELAKKEGDPGVRGISILLSNKDSPVKLLKALREDPGIIRSLERSQFAGALLAAHGIGVEDIRNLASGDTRTAYSAAEKIISKLDGVELTEDGISLRVGQHEAVERLAAFLDAGGLVTTKVRPEMAGLYRKVQMHAARSALREASWREYISAKSREYVHALWVRHRQPEWLPEAYSIDYRAMFDEETLPYIF